MSNLQIVNVMSLSANIQTGEKIQNTVINQDEDTNKPLLQMLKSYIYEEHTSKKSLLTNTALKHILEKEFNINLDYTTEMESEIYLKTFKSLLKMWPGLDEFDELVDRARRNKSFNVKVMLNRLYIMLKDYLSVNLDITKERMKPYMESLEKQSSEEQKKNKSDAEDSSEVVMEITSTRLQLNRLIFSKPNPRLDNTIFNIVEGGYSSKITMNLYTLKQILNWPFVEASISVPSFTCYRRNNSIIKRAIVNLKNPKNSNGHKESLDMEEIFYRKTDSKSEQVSKRIVLIFLNQLIEQTKLCKLADGDLIRLLISEFKTDINRGPKVFKTGEYQFYLNNHRYVRHLATEVSECPTEFRSKGIDPDNFDLCLEEVLTPMQLYHTSKLTICSSYGDKVEFSNMNGALDENACSFKVHCMMCDVKFDLLSNVRDLMQHFVDHHQHEHDWVCTSCHKSFYMTYLAGNRWEHACNVWQ